MSEDLRLERVYDAAPETVFDAFTDPEAQKELYADAPDWIVESACDLRVGGRWTIEFGPPGGRAALETCVFRVVDRPRRLVYVSTMRMPDGTSFDTDVEVRFDEEPGGRTRLTILQRGFPTPRLRDELAGGWPSILDGLGRVVAARPGRVGPEGRAGDAGRRPPEGRAAGVGRAGRARPALPVRHGPDRAQPGPPADQRRPAAIQHPTAVDRRHLRVPGRRIPGHHGHPRRPDRPAPAC